MSRLIDADLLKKNIAKWLQGGDPQETEMVKLDDIAVSVIMEIDQQPPAFDTEKVVAELETFANLSEDRWVNGTSNHAYQERKCWVKAIDIVKRGGIE